MPVSRIFISVLLLLFACQSPAQNNLAKRENLKGDDVVPILTFPGITQADFKDAFTVLDECLIMDEPRFGFNYPFIAPGGHYGGCWWQLDASLALYGTKWVNQTFSENMLRGFMAVQKPDGRIPLYGHNEVPGYPTGSSLPKLFLASNAVLRQSKDEELKRSMYTCLTKYLNWWFSDLRRDTETGLITGVFEESFPPVEKRVKAVAQVDLNVEVTAGCLYVAELAKQLGITGDYKKYVSLAAALKASVNQYMWNESKGAYFNYHIKEKKLDDRLVAYAFDPFRMNIAPEKRIRKMIEMLTDNRYFNWAGNAVTSVAKTDSTYNETVGDYNGAPAWSGDIWSLRNVSLIEGLEDIGRFDLASKLSLKTVRLFNKNYTEFLKPSDGSGQGVKRYAWSAAQYIQIIIEKILGVDYNAHTGIITIRPNLDDALTGQQIALERLLLPNGNRLAVSVRKEGTSITIKYDISGTNTGMNVIVAIPAAGKVYKLANNKGSKLIKAKQPSAIIYQVFNGEKYSGQFTFAEVI